MHVKIDFMKRFWVLLSFLLFLFAACNSGNEKAKRLLSFIKNYEMQVDSLQRAINLATFNAAVTGQGNYYGEAAKLEIRLSEIYSNQENFNFLKKLRESKSIKDESLKRQLDILYYNYLPFQIPENQRVEIIISENKIKRMFSVFRSMYKKQMITNNQIDAILLNSTDSKELEGVWKASKKVGRILSKKFIRLVKTRNKAAKSLGFSNYYEMMQIANDQDPAQIEQLFDELDILTRGPYEQLKREMDSFLSKRYDVPEEELMPWHYQSRFFQESPHIYEQDLNDYYREKDIAKITADFYNGIGLSIDSILANSDLYEKTGKAQHAFSYPIDRDGDVRILANISPNYYWMTTMLYEGGFSLYLKNTDKNLPYLLRQPSHFCTNDGVATMFSNMSSNSVWMKEMIGISDEEEEKIHDTSVKTIRLDKFVFSRWAQVMYHFEKAMYENPDQNLNQLWWDLVADYQMLNQPKGRDKPDWASKIHLLIRPCTYHNYMLGDLFASQLFSYITTNILGSQDKCTDGCTKNKAIGRYLRKTIFKTGKSRNWNETILQATGEELTPTYFTRLFIAME